MDVQRLLNFYRKGMRDFSGADLSGAVLNGLQLSHASFAGAKMVGSVLINADLSSSSLVGADLSGANMIGAYLARADLSRSTLHSVNLQRADLTSSSLSRAICRDVTLGETVLGDLNVESLADADGVRHSAPSVVDHRTVMKSLRTPNLKSFLRKCGMPEVFVEYSVSCAESLNGSILHKMLCSTFISYGQPDAAFARRLYEALHRNGVTTFFFEAHAVPGKKLHKVMRDGVNDHDRTVLICSKGSLDRSGVQNEVEQVLMREARNRGESFLIPIRLDDFLFDEWKPSRPDLKQEICDRVVADFRGADTDEVKFDAALQRLIGALKI